VSTLSGPAYGEAGARAPSRFPTRHPRAATLVRLRVAAGRDVLDTMLAHGANRASLPELALRAAQLERPRHRRALARTLRRVVVEATGSRPPARATAVTIARRQILAQRDGVLALAERLDSPQPAHAAGIAIAQRLVTDALRSPLYVETQSETLGPLARQAVANMDAAARHPSG
jgi:hypothetical protein